MRQIILSMVLLIGVLSVKAQLSGTYTIDPSGSGISNFISFNSAIQALENDGVSGPVTFEVKQGIYAEQVDIPEIDGVNALDTLLFRSAPSNTAPVVIRYAPNQSDPFVLRLKGTDYCTLSGMKIENTGDSIYKTALSISDTAFHVRISDCHIVGGTAGSLNFAAIESYGRNDSLRILNCTVLGGSVGIRCGIGTYDSAAFARISGNEVLHHQVSGIAASHYGSMVVSHNKVRSDSLDSLVSANTGITVSQLLRCEVFANSIGSETGFGYGLGLGLSSIQGLSYEYSRVYNNCILAGSPVCSSAVNGYFLSDVSYIESINNTFIAHSEDPSSRGIKVDSNSSHLQFRNNISRVKRGAALFVDGSNAIVESDHNGYYSEEDDAILFDGNVYNDIESFSATELLDINSLIHPFDFTNEIECRLCDNTLDNRADPVKWLRNDIDGEVRNPWTPDIGCREFIDPTSSFFGDDTLLCDDQVLLALGGASSVTWSVNGNSSTGITNLINNTGCEPDTYQISATVMTQSCGIGNDAFELKLVPTPRLIDDTTICALDSMALSVCAGEDSDVLWSNWAITSNIWITEGGVYTVKKSEAGCVIRDTVVINASSLLTLADSELCEWEAPLIVDASIDGGLNYSWSGGDTVNGPVNALSETGRYILTVEDVYGCEQVDSMQVYVVAEPEATITIPSQSGYIFIFDASMSPYLTPKSSIYWDFGATATPRFSTNMTETVIYPWSNPSNPMTPAVYLKIDNGCGIDEASMIVTMPWSPPPPGVTEPSEDQFGTFYPNPSIEKVNYKVDPRRVGTTLIIVDDLGRKMHSQKIFQATGQIDVSSLSAGVYSIIWSDDPNIGLRLVLK